MLVSKYFVPSVIQDSSYARHLRFLNMSKAKNIDRMDSTVHTNINDTDGEQLDSQSESKQVSRPKNIYKIQD